ncbi:MAG: hypothetical protein PHY99_10175 [Bacteroidales bacterium]|nr:hypothetical protein [Bacteroidales bacterium]
MQQNSKIIDLLWIPVGIASFFVFSSRFSPLLNSDDAINILMIKDLRFPQDLYAWGQDRGGSLIPSLGWPLNHIAGLSVLWSESLIHYLILFVGYWCLSRFFKSGVSKLIFAIAWFFPPYWFWSLSRFPFGIQYSLTGLALYILWVRKPVNSSGFKQLLPIFLATLVLATSLWVSDLNVTSIVALLLISLYSLKSRGLSFRQVLMMPAFKLIVITSALGIAFLLYAKVHAVETISYNHGILNNFSQIFESLAGLLSSVWHIITFQRETILFSVFGILAIILIALSLLWRPALNRVQKRTCLFFVLDSAILLMTILFSHWAYSNGVSRRYFTGIYIGITIIILIVMENNSGKRRIILQAIAVTAVLIGGISYIHYLKTVYPKTLKPMASVMGEFSRLGEIGVIGEYWNSYITACPDPYQITAIPHDSSFSRSQMLVDEVFTKPKLYVIKDMWLNEFPDSMYQYGYKLKRMGASFEIGNCVVNEYEKVTEKRDFYPKDLIFLDHHALFDSISSRTVVIADSSCRECREKHLIYGPGISLVKGKYQVLFFLRFDQIRPGNDLAILDITAGHGQIQLARSVINARDVTGGRNQCFPLNFENPVMSDHVEFRLFFLGNSSITFDHISLR